MDIIEERYQLAEGRICEIVKVQEIANEYKEYFKKTAEFIQLVLDAYKNVGVLTQMDELRAQNRALYEDISIDHYEQSYANPTYACDKFGVEYGQLLSFLAVEIRSMIPYAFETRQEDLTIRMELFVEIYNLFAYAYAEAQPGQSVEEMIPSAESVKETLYWFVNDYFEMGARQKVREQVISEDNFAVKVIMESDLEDLRYLYRYGAFVSSQVEEMARYLNSLSQERIQMIADTYTEGFRIGFVKANKDLSKKKVVAIHYMIGFERIIRAAIKNFEKLGLQPTISRETNSIFRKKGMESVGCFGAEINKQFLYDHRNDQALFLDKRFVNRRLEVLKLAYEEVKERAALFAGPAAVEVFGEVPFVPVSKKEACSFSAEQQQLVTELKGSMAEILNKYLKCEEYGYTIIAFPVPDIGARFDEIFDETIKLNTLAYVLYEQIQAVLIRTLNKASYVEIKGQNGNKTDLRVALYPLKDLERETIFENCVADVNIPVGEVFTSPVLAGTNGKLHVTRVFLNQLEYQNLEIDFKDGMIQQYTCTNFDDGESNKTYIKENVLCNHNTLPMGEFAIGTNTTAYMMARKYDIESLLPILIAEKTGPHFAVGDTCYARSEDIKVYNEDGKEIVAKDNEVSLLRKTESSKAYYSCHTDITIPYDELGSIIAYDSHNNAYPIIEKGRFVLEGTEELNRPFDEN